MKYFSKSTFLRILVHKNMFGLIWQIVFKLEYLSVDFFILLSFIMESYFIL